VSEVAGLRERVVRARAAVDALPPFATAGLGEPDARTGERWQRLNVAGHLVEMLPFWTAQVRSAVEAGATSIGRDESGYQARREGIERGPRLDDAELRRRVHESIDGLLTLLGAMSDGDLARPVTTRVAGGESRHVDVRTVMEELLVGHLEAHIRQIEELPPS
jgi:hypothetical protein